MSRSRTLLHWKLEIRRDRSERLDGTARYLSNYVRHSAISHFRAVVLRARQTALRIAGRRRTAFASPALGTMPSKPHAERLRCSFSLTAEGRLNRLPATRRGEAAGIVPAFRSPARDNRSRCAESFARMSPVCRTGGRGSNKLRSRNSFGRLRMQVYRSPTQNRISWYSLRRLVPAPTAVRFIQDV